jgi:hypothetical protein
MWAIVHSVRPSAADFLDIFHRKIMFCLILGKQLIWLEFHMNKLVVSLNRTNQYDTVMTNGKQDEFTLFILTLNKKAVSLQAWRGPWGSRSLRLPEFLDNQHMKAPPSPSTKEVTIVLLSDSGSVDPSSLMRPKRKYQCKIPLTPSAFQLAEQCLSLMSHRLPHPNSNPYTKKYFSFSLVFWHV